MSPRNQRGGRGGGGFFRRPVFRRDSIGSNSELSFKEKARAGRLNKSSSSSVSIQSYTGQEKQQHLPPVRALSKEPLISSASRVDRTMTQQQQQEQRPKAAERHGIVTKPSNRHKYHATCSALLTSSASVSTSPTFTEEDCHHVRVAVRLRPLNPLEVLASKQTITSPINTNNSSHYHSSLSNSDQYDSFKAWTVERTKGGKDVLVQKAANPKIEGKNMFTFDGVFQEHMGTAHVYENFAKPIVSAVLGGRHGTIFTYGTSGSGKTHSMQGDGKKGSLHEDGIIQLAARDLFQHIQRDAGKRDYTVRISFFEIYNEQVRDLLASSSSNNNNNKNGSTTPRCSPTHQGRAASPSMRSVKSSTESGNRFTFDAPPRAAAAATTPITHSSSASHHHLTMRDAEKKQVSSVDDVLKLLYAGNQNRAVATTILNDTSSRSHAIFRLTIESREHYGSHADDHIIRVSALNFVDLAGSENTAKAATVGSRRRESGKINQSLLSLSQVIHALSLPPKKRPKFINYRNSKLTRILQPQLSGNAVLAILCCATPARANLEETRGTLKFGASAKRIEMKPVVNEIIDDKTLIRKLQRDLKEAQDAIRAMEMKNAPSITTMAEDKKPSSKEKSKNPDPLNTSLQVSTVATELSHAHSESGASGSGDQVGDREHRCETSATREGAPSSNRAGCSPLPSPTMTPERVASPNNLSASNLHFAEMSALLLRDGQLRSCDHDSAAERSMERDGNSTISDSSSRRPPPVCIVQDSPPSEVTIIRSPLSDMGDDVDIHVRLEDAEERCRFLEEKLDAADRLVELMTRDLRNARLCIHELVFRNVRLENQLAATNANTTPATANNISALEISQTGSRSEDDNHNKTSARMQSERIGI